MHNFPEENRKFQSFNSRIRNAYSNEEIRNILEDLSPEHVKDRLQVLAEKRGRKRSAKSDGYKENYHAFSNGSFEVVSSSHEVTFVRKGFGLIFHSENGSIKEFDAIPIWRSLNLVEEIIQTGDISL